MAIVPYSCIAQEHRRSPVPVAGKASPTPSRPSGSGRANTMQYITLPPSMEAVMTEYRYYNAGVDPDTKLFENVRSKTIKRELQGCLDHLHRDVTVHQFHVKRRKLDSLPGYGDLEKCLSASVKRIPELLDRMERSPSVEPRYLLYGYFSLHWSLLYGHHAGVYTNMFLNLAWTDLGLQGSISHTLLCTALADTVKRYQDPSKREVLSRFMCHDLRTSNRYYASNPGVKEALGIRYMFQQSFAQATMDAQAEAGMEPEAAGPSAARASERQSERHPPFEQGEL
ncbi:hypothetical protein KUCAC02_009554 [Chaenocephalus aceratus]|nr:hypothetical protein KUCAC02_009554 [Chaenocephalus aceratus]